MFNFSLRVFVPLFIFLCVSHANAQNKVVVVPLGGDVAPRYAIGDTGPAGGIVFHITDAGLHGLEAAPADQSAGAPWNCDGADVTGVVNIAAASVPDTNSGASNTPLIALACPGAAVSAAVHAAVYVWPNGQSDGFLPNKEELNLLYDQKDVVGGFSGIYYWSSSEYDSEFAWYQDFFGGVGGGEQGINGKDPGGRDRVRAVRKF